MQEVWRELVNQLYDFLLANVILAGHFARDCLTGGGGGGGECRNCGEEGHHSKDCKLLLCTRGHGIRTNFCVSH
jgi:hypothetical protein